jgi:hypothetical protein
MLHAEPTRVVASPDTPIESIDVVDIRPELTIRPPAYPVSSRNIGRSACWRPKWRRIGKMLEKLRIESLKMRRLSDH